MRARSLPKQTLARLLLGFSLLLAFLSQAQACAICLKGITITPGQKLDAADQVVIALQLADPEQFRIIEVVKGNVAVDGTITEPGLSDPAAQAVMSPDGQMPGEAIPAAPQGKPLLLVRDRVSEKWTSIGAIDAVYAGWLRDLVATNRGKEARPARRIWPQLALTSSELSEAEWRERVAVVAPQIESGEPLVAEIAYGELARAPYAAMLSLKSRLDPEKIAAWVYDPKLADRGPGYTLLLGIVGGPNDAVALERRIDSALTTGDATNLSAMLAADLELRGPTRVAWLEQTYFADRRRTLPEIEAALLALSVHGGADGTVSRARVVEAYRYFIKERRPMAGFVAMELADWEAWEATADYVDIIRSKAVKDPAGEFAILSYLHQSPTTAAEAASQQSTGQPE